MELSTKFRFWDTVKHEMIPWEKVINAYERYACNIATLFNVHSVVPLQYTGFKDENDVEIYVGDICEFDNNGRFVVKLEHWLECYADWIGKPECGYQMRDFCRYEKSKIIGNMFTHPELLIITK